MHLRFSEYRRLLERAESFSAESSDYRYAPLFADLGEGLRVRVKPETNANWAAEWIVGYDISVGINHGLLNETFSTYRAQKPAEMKYLASLRERELPHAQERLKQSEDRRRKRENKARNRGIAAGKQRLEQLLAR